MKMGIDSEGCGVDKDGRVYPVLPQHYKFSLSDQEARRIQMELFESCWTRLWDVAPRHPLLVVRAIRYIRTLRPYPYAHTGNVLMVHVYPALFDRPRWPARCLRPANVHGFMQDDPQMPYKRVWTAADLRDLADWLRREVVEENWWRSQT